MRFSCFRFDSVASANVVASSGAFWLLISTCRSVRNVTNHPLAEEKNR